MQSQVRACIMADKNEAKHTEKPSIALTIEAQNSVGDKIKEMGFEIVTINFVEDEPIIGNGDGKTFVDCLYFSPDFFSWFLMAKDQKERYERNIIGRDKVVSCVKEAGWIHVPSAGLDAFYTILENIKLRTHDGDDANGVFLTHAPGVSGAAMAEYVMAYILNIAKKIPHHIELQRQRRWEKVAQKTLNGATLGILGCGMYEH